MQEAGAEAILAPARRMTKGSTGARRVAPPQT